MQIKIDRDVPVPTRGVKRDYPFADMAVGDSFFLPGLKASTMYQVGLKWTKASGSPAKFTAREAEVNGEKGARVWRVS